MSAITETALLEPVGCEDSDLHRSHEVKEFVKVLLNS